MRYEGKTKFSKLKLENQAKKEEDKQDLSDIIEISDEADAIIQEIKQGFEKLRLSNLMK